MDNIREWISDNLRYLILGAGVLLVLLILIFGIRSCSRAASNSDGQSTNEITEQDSGDVEGDLEPEEEEEPLVEDDSALLDIVSTYYYALGSRDGDAVSSLTENMTSSDVSAVINANNYITGYDVEHVYSKSGLTEGSYVVYVKYNYSCDGISEKVPALSQMYVVTSADGSLKIDANAEKDTEISAYLTKVMNDSDVKKLRSDAETEYNETIAANPELEEYLNGMGEESNVPTEYSEGQILTATSEVNVREEASSDADVIGGLDEGDEVEALGREGEWVKISYDGQEAYVFGEYLSEQ